MQELAFAVIGAGFWGGFQIAAWKEVPGARLVALCDRNDEQAAAIAQKFGVSKVYANAQEMLRSQSLDFVDVAVGPEAHEQLVLLAANQRLPVICQKPMAMDYPTCERMVKTCREAGVIFLIHENYRWQTPMRRVKELIVSARIGRPFRAHVQFSLGEIGLYDNQPYLYTQAHFALNDMGPHLLDLPRFFFGEPSSVYAREFNVHPRFAGEDVVSVVLGYDRLTCHCELSWRTSSYEVSTCGGSSFDYEVPGNLSRPVPQVAGRVRCETAVAFGPTPTSGDLENGCQARHGIRGSFPRGAGADGRGLLSTPALLAATT
ncbi:MAG: Gfo/Idh/MocA family oxidoreductase [Acidobacteria bacterium]|nr:Gfo/Idh/MocA family oxidoreductase [Acidobacteriota bacterium]MCI0722136.1 Gfo/Idh/MocA family oxidoreductase [Acidobacteriota bacterium]